MILPVSQQLLWQRDNADVMRLNLFRYHQPTAMDSLLSVERKQENLRKSVLSNAETFHAIPNDCVSSKQLHISQRIIKQMYFQLNMFLTAWVGF